eukprot:jgi/Mesvir1/15605/Mv03214-RA.2
MMRTTANLSTWKRLSRRCPWARTRCWNRPRALARPCACSAPRWLGGNTTHASGWPRPRMSVLGSREQMCIHSAVSKVKGHAQNHMCRAVTSARSCGHHIRLQSYLRDHPEVAEEPMDIEDLVQLGRTQGPCPYFLSKELAAGAELIFMPYNYLVDPQHRASLGFVDWENSVLIFDEAHNLEGVCADAASFDLRTADLAACVQEVSRAIELEEYRAASGAGDGGADASDAVESLLDACRGADVDMLRTLKGILLALVDKLRAVPLPPEGFTRPGPYILEFFAEGLNITPANVTAILDTADAVISALQDEAADMGRKSQMAPTSYKLHMLRSALTAAMAPARKAGPWAEVIRRSYKVHIHNEAVATRTGQKLGVASSKTAPTLSYWCFNPGVAMLDFPNVLGVRSILLTSGTLSPLDSFAHELCLPFPVRLENPHVIQPDQVWVGVVCTGPSGHTLNSSFRTRDELEYKQELGNAIVNFARIVPDGLLVFFPSYVVLKSCIDCWQAEPRKVEGAAAVYAPSIWERISKLKQPVVEPRESALFGQAQEDFLAKLDDPATSGAVFFAVCRGKVSEGLDFADRAGRAVVVTGIPYAQHVDPKVRLKRAHLEEMAHTYPKGSKPLRGDQWYSQQATRAVNQAIGRVIRHRNDYGAIILADERFAKQSVLGELSLWLRPYAKKYDRFGEVTATLTRFFREKRAALGPGAVSKKGPAQEGPPGIDLLASGTGRNPYSATADKPSGRGPIAIGYERENQAIFGSYGQTNGGAGGIKPKVEGNASAREGPWEDAPVNPLASLSGFLGQPKRSSLADNSDSPSLSQALLSEASRSNAANGAPLLLSLSERLLQGGGGINSGGTGNTNNNQGAAKGKDASRLDLFQAASAANARPGMVTTGIRPALAGSKRGRLADDGDMAAAAAVGGEPEPLIVGPAHVVAALRQKRLLQEMGVETGNSSEPSPLPPSLLPSAPARDSANVANDTTTRADHRRENCQMRDNVRGDDPQAAVQLASGQGHAARGDAARVLGPPSASAEAGGKRGGLRDAMEEERGKGKEAEKGMVKASGRWEGKAEGAGQAKEKAKAGGAVGDNVNAAGQPPREDKHKAAASKSQAYLKQIKEQLSKEEFARFTSALHRYKSSSTGGSRTSANPAATSPMVTNDAMHSKDTRNPRESPRERTDGADATTPRDAVDPFESRSNGAKEPQQNKGGSDGKGTQDPKETENGNECKGAKNTEDTKGSADIKDASVERTSGKLTTDLNGSKDAPKDAFGELLGTMMQLFGAAGGSRRPLLEGFGLFVPNSPTKQARFRRLLEAQGLEASEAGEGERRSGKGDVTAARGKGEASGAGGKDEASAICGKAATSTGRGNGAAPASDRAHTCPEVVAKNAREEAGARATPPAAVTATATVAAATDGTAGMSGGAPGGANNMSKQKPKAAQGQEYLALLKRQLSGDEYARLTRALRDYQAAKAPQEPAPSGASAATAATTVTPPGTAPVTGDGNPSTGVNKDITTTTGDGGTSSGGDRETTATRGRSPYNAGDRAVTTKSDRATAGKTHTTTAGNPVDAFEGLLGVIGQLLGGRGGARLGLLQGFGLFVPHSPTRRGRFEALLKQEEAAAAAALAPPAVAAGTGAGVAAAMGVKPACRRQLEAEGSFSGAAMVGKQRVSNGENGESAGDVTAEEATLQMGRGEADKASIRGKSPMGTHPAATACKDSVKGERVMLASGTLHGHQDQQSTPCDGEGTGVHATDTNTSTLPDWSTLHEEDSQPTCHEGDRATDSPRGSGPAEHPHVNRPAGRQHVTGSPADVSKKRICAGPLVAGARDVGEHAVVPSGRGASPWVAAGGSSQGPVGPPLLFSQGPDDGVGEPLLTPSDPSFVTPVPFHLSSQSAGAAAVSDRHRGSCTGATASPGLQQGSLGRQEPHRPVPGDSSSGRQYLSLSQQSSQSGRGAADTPGILGSQAGHSSSARSLHAGRSSNQTPNNQSLNLPTPNKLAASLKSSGHSLTPKRAARTCPVCDGRPQAPFSARCGHTCCYMCWQKLLNAQDNVLGAADRKHKRPKKCPVCEEPVRHSQLEKLYFE